MTDGQHEQYYRTLIPALGVAKDACCVATVQCRGRLRQMWGLGCSRGATSPASSGMTSTATHTATQSAVRDWRFLNQGFAGHRF